MVVKSRSPAVGPSVSSWGGCIVVWSEAEGGSRLARAKYFWGRAQRLLGGGGADLGRRVARGPGPTRAGPDLGPRRARLGARPDSAPDLGPVSAGPGPGPDLSRTWVGPGRRLGRTWAWVRPESDSGAGSSRTWVGPGSGSDLSRTWVGTRVGPGTGPGTRPDLARRRHRL